jgi:hypothetical protein
MESVSEYRYDAFNRRVRKVVDGDADGGINGPSDGDEETEFVYGGQGEWQLLEEYDAMGTGTTLRASCAYGIYIDEIVEALRDTDNDLVVDDPLYYHQDGHQDDLFSVQAITDAALFASDPGGVA